MRRVCVFIGSSSGLGSKYIDATVALAQQIAQRKLSVVYGGAQVGLMGTLANAALIAGGEVIGVIPKLLASQEIVHQGLSKLHIVESMQVRKAMMSDLSDAFIVMPGGLGTLEEVFEVWNSVKMGLHKKPIGFLNIDGYFDLLLDFLNNVSNESFINQEKLDLAIVSENPTLLLNRIAGDFDKSLSS